MPQRLFANAPAQTTVPLAIASGAASVVGASTANFPAPAAGQQMTLLFTDSGNPAFNANTPLATPFAYAYCTTNTVGTNTLSGLTWNVAGTTATAFFAGATVAYSILADDINASFPIVIDEQILTVNTASVRIPAAGSFPATGYRALRIAIYGKTTATAAGTYVEDISLRYNGDSGANYGMTTWKTDKGTGLSVFNSNSATSILAFSLATSATDASTIGAQANADIDGYATAFAWKAWHCRNVSGDQLGQFTRLVHGIWASSAAITSLTLTPVTSQFLAGCTFTTEAVP